MLMDWKDALGGATFKNYAEQSGAWEGMAASAIKGTEVAAGIAVGTMVATDMGWRPVDSLTEGDRVMTFDGGLQPITAIRRGLNGACADECPRSTWPLLVPHGVLGNKRPLTLMPEQSVLVESDTAEDIYGDPFVLVPAATLVGLMGIRRVAPDAPQEAVMLGFENDEIVYVNGSALVFCPAQMAGGTLSLDQLDDIGGLSQYSVLSFMEARAVVGDLMASYDVHGTSVTNICTA